MKRGAAALVAASLLAGCVVVPVTREVYDTHCRTMRREVQLEAAMVGQLRSCGGQECAAIMATMGLVTAASLVVSGSIAIVGNVVYWFENEANCRRAAVPPAAAANQPGGPPPAPR